MELTDLAVKTVQPVLQEATRLYLPRSVTIKLETRPDASRFFHGAGNLYLGSHECMTSTLQNEFFPNHNEMSFTRSSDTDAEYMVLNTH